jgi:hypothetical protein
MGPMDEQQPNPYAPPRAETDFAVGLAGPYQVLRREGEFVVIPVLGASFPPRCVVCNEPGQHRLRRKLWWHPPGYYALICVGWVIYAIVAMIVRKSADFEIGLCDAHLARRRNAILLGWLGVPACIAAGALLIDLAPALATMLFIVSFGLLVTSLVMVRLVSASRIQDGTAWIKVGRPFLDSL